MLNHLSAETSSVKWECCLDGMEIAVTWKADTSVTQPIRGSSASSVSSASCIAQSNGVSWGDQDEKEVDQLSNRGR